jgi:hypothetical protein
MPMHEMPRTPKHLIPATLRQTAERARHYIELATGQVERTARLNAERPDLVLDPAPALLQRNVLRKMLKLAQFGPPTPGTVRKLYNLQREYERISRRGGREFLAYVNRVMGATGQTAG